MASPERPVYKGKTTLISVQIRRRPDDNAAIVRVGARTKKEGLPIWTDPSRQERDDLVSELQAAFGEQQVSVRPIDNGETTDREIVVLAPRPKPASKGKPRVAPEDHVVTAMLAVEGFIQDRLTAIETEGEKHFQAMVKGPLSDGIQDILANPDIADGDKADAIRNLRELHRQQHRGRGHGKGE